MYIYDYYLSTINLINSEAVISLFLKLRTDLDISKQESAGKTVYIIKDPSTGRFFRLKEMEYFIANLFDGKNDSESIADKFYQRFEAKIDSDQIEKFGQRLSSLGLLEDTGVREELASLRPKRSLFGRLLFIKLKAVNPEKFIENSYKLAHPFYSKTAMRIYALLVLLAALITIANFGDMLYQAKRFFVPQIIPLVWITIFFVTLLHELSHTYSCRLHGGRVTDMGFLLLYFQPCFYSNVSDAYLFPDRKKRIAVTLAGIISQIVIWALAVMVWRVTSTDNIINSVAFIIIALSFVGITFNVNPLLKLDGYYFLVDYWEIPNLRQKAFRHLRQNFLGLASDEQRLSVTPREHRIFLYYGIASLLYSGALIGYIFFLVGRFIGLQFGSFGVAVYIAIVLYFIIDAMNKGKVFQAAYNQRGAILKPGRLITIGAVIIVLILVLIFIKAPLRITNDCLILPLEQISLRSSELGSAELFIEKANEEKIFKQYQLIGQDFSVLSIIPACKVGDIVRSGDLIASIKSNVYETEKLKRLANLKQAKKQLVLLEKGPQPEEVKQTEDIINQVRAKLEKSNLDLLRAESLYAHSLIPENQVEESRTDNKVLKSELGFYNKQLVLLKRGARPEEIDIARAEVDQLAAILEHITDQLEQTIIESPVNGIVSQVNNGDTIIAIARTDTIRVRIDVPEKEIAAVLVNNSIKMKVHSYPGLTYSGVVTKIVPHVFHRENDRKVFHVYAQASNIEGLLKPGMTGKAKINCGKRPLYRLILWRVVRFLRIEFWSWW